MFSFEVILFVVCSTILWTVIFRTLTAYLPEFSFLIKANSWDDVIVQWVFWVPACLIISALLTTGNKIAYGSDWCAYFNYHQIVYDSLKNGELLHWASGLSGGYPWAGHPDQPGTTPLMLPVMLFGVVFGNFVANWLRYVIMS